MENISSSNGLEKRPKLRFPGFEEPWKAVLLSDYFAKNIKKNTDGAISNVICNSAKQGLIPQREYFDKDIANSDNTDGYYIIETNDFVYNPRKSTDAPYGPISIYKYSGTGIVSPLYLCFKAIREIDHLYFEWYFRSTAWHRYIYMSGDSGTRHDRVSIKDDVFFAMPINLPSESEQKRIASFLDAINQRIDKQRALVEALKKYKRGLLQRMFPRDGATVPELRFAGFTGDWEQRKLGEIYQNIGNAFVGTATPYYVEHGHFYLESNNIKDGQINRNSEIFINDEFYERQKDKWLHTGDMVMVQSGHVGHTAVIPEELDNSAAHALIMFRNPKVEIEPYFLNYQYQTIKSKKKIENITTGNTIKHILASDMQEFEVDVPKIDEQKQIANYFLRLDHFITLHQRKLETYRKYKTGLIQQLFI